MGQLLPEQKYHFAIEANVASMTPESGSGLGRIGDQTVFQSVFQKAVRHTLSVLEIYPSAVHAGLATISEYAEKCGGRHWAGAAKTTGNAPSAAGFSAARIWTQGNGSPRETWAGRTARASSMEVLAGLRAFRGYVRMSTSAVGLTVADADGAKEIDCYV
jgi:hypothetical protein